MCRILVGILRGNVFGPVLYTLFTHDLPIRDDVTFATYADDTALFSSSESPSEASGCIQQLDCFHHRLNKWNIKVKTQKSSHLTFTTRGGNCPSVFLNGIAISNDNIVKFLGLHPDRGLKWKAHISARRK